MTVEENWWIGFFKGPFGEIQIEGKHRDTTLKDVDWICASLGEGPKRVLDAPCGAGRHSLELARRGHTVLGVDFNPQVLEAAESRAKAEGLSVVFRQVDLRELGEPPEYDAVTCLWTSLGYFNDEENELTLRNLASAVKPGGHLFLDLLTQESLFRRFEARGWFAEGEGAERVRILEERNWNAQTGRAEVIWTFLENGKERSCPTSIRVYSCHELVTALRRLGFDSFSCLGDDGAPFHPGSNRLWLTAHKG